MASFSLKTLFASCLFLGLPAVSVFGNNDDIYPAADDARAAITFDGKGFIVEGKRVFIASGSVHYARVPKEMWREVLLKLKRSGFNTVETYVFWNYHEPEEGKFDFTTTSHDLGAFLDLAKDAGLYAVVRVGPYSCAEWQNGGFPTWLTFKPGLQVRTDNAAFYAAMDPWFDALLPIVAKRQIHKGGSVIGVQLENEHPQFWGMGTPSPYFAHLLKKAQGVGLEVPMWMSGLHHAHDPAGWKPFDSADRKSPWYSTELWIAWYDLYGPQNNPGYERAPWDVVANGGAGFNIYMYYGGTNFDYWNDDEDTASYDYGTLVGQTGDTRQLYRRMKRLALFTGSFPDILANSANASDKYRDFAPGVHVRARTSPAGTIVFLPNGPKDQAVALKDSAQIKIAANEMVPLVLQAPISPDVTIGEADTRLLGIVSQGDTTTLVAYGEAGDTNRLALDFNSAPKGEPASSDPATFRVDHGSEIAPTVYMTFPVTGTGVLTWKIGVKTFRLFAMSKETADKTWFVDSSAGKQIVIGPDYLGEFSLNQTGDPQVQIETPLNDPAPDDILVYGAGDTPHHIKGNATPDVPPMSSLPTGTWEMAVDNGPLTSGLDDQSWYTLPDGNPPAMGQDGDGSAYAWYRVALHGSDAGAYSFANIGDDASFYLDGKLAGTYDHKVRHGSHSQGKPNEVTLADMPGAHELEVFVSNAGRYKFFNHIGSLDHTDMKKGLAGPVKSPSGAALTGWKMKGGEDPANPSLGWSPVADSHGVPTFYRAHLALQGSPSTGAVYRFVTTGLSRGSVWLNGHNLGRYPEILKGCMGIWLPSCWMTSGDNTLIVFDEQGAAIDRASIQLETGATRKTTTVP